MFKRYKHLWLLLIAGLFIYGCKEQNKNAGGKPSPKDTVATKTDTIPAAAIKGDFDGDGVTEYAWITDPKIDTSGMDCLGGCSIMINFSNKRIPVITKENSISGELTNLGKLNKIQGDELGLLPSNFAGCWANYYLYTFKENQWKLVVDPFPTHCNQFEDSVKVAKIDPVNADHLIITYSEHTGDEILTKTNSVAIKN